jgi:3-hydroxyisobutyrate dehydrogenase-like beta-hydroxyacid dehydrogenase
MIAGDFTQEVTFTPVLRLKDVEYALSLAETVGVGTPFGAVARAAFRRLIDLGGGEQNESRIIEVARGK